jgi:hypothetical protein
METCEYVVMRLRGTAIEMQSTNAATIHQLFSVLALLIDEFGVSASKLPTSRTFYWRLYGLGEKLEEAWALIVECLDTRGWKPLEDHPQSPGTSRARVFCLGLRDED